MHSCNGSASFVSKLVALLLAMMSGCFGYVLHRQLESMGISNLVVRPRNWDEYGSKVQTDGRDARELCSCLDRHLAGNDRALSVVCVPTEEQERSRRLSRQREVLAKERKRLKKCRCQQCPLLRENELVGK
jgi:transposase